MIKQYKIEVPRGYWILDNKIWNLHRNRNYYRRKWCKGFSKFLPDSDDDRSDQESDYTEVSAVIESESPAELAEGLSSLSIQDLPLLSSVSEGDVFAMHLKPASAVMDIE